MFATKTVNPFYARRTTGTHRPHEEPAPLAGKTFIGVERDPEYFKYACRRVERAWKDRHRRPA